MDTTTEQVGYKVWGQQKTYLEEPDCMKVIAMFRFLMEALDFVDYAVGRGCKVVLTGPCKMVTHYPRKKVTL